jgi:hypothetical protein
MLEGEMLFELEGEPERVIKAGETFWEPGGDVIHYQDGNNRTDSWSRFLVTMMCAPGQPMLTLVDEKEPAERKHPRAPRPDATSLPSLTARRTSRACSRLLPAVISGSNSLVITDRSVPAAELSVVPVPSGSVSRTGRAGSRRRAAG